MIDASAAEHEAAHLVVGLALGLRLRRASTVPSVIDGIVTLGYTWFGGNAREGLARSLMYCAGIAWEARPGGAPVAATQDSKLARQYFRSAHDLATGVKIAAELIDSRRRAHARLASELCDRDLTAADVESLVLDVA